MTKSLKSHPKGHHGGGGGHRHHHHHHRHRHRREQRNGEDEDTNGGRESRHHHWVSSTRVEFYFFPVENYFFPPSLRIFPLWRRKSCQEHEDKRTSVCLCPMNDDNLVILVLERSEKSNIYVDTVWFHLSVMNEFYGASVRGDFMIVKYNAMTFQIWLQVLIRICGNIIHLWNNIIPYHKLICVYLFRLYCM